jgi:endonuclease YncB( thermonuclease family)
MESIYRYSKIERRKAMVRKEERVKKVINGDTFKTASRKNLVRLANIDVPEKGQPCSAQAREALRKIIEGEEVRINTVSRYKYGRTVADFYKDREYLKKKKKMEKKIK